MCLNPISVALPRMPLYGSRVIQVPCGKCVDCITRYQNDWTIRLNEEAKCHKYTYFLTLTYSDTTCPRRSLSGDSVSSVASAVGALIPSDSLSLARSRPSDFYDYLRADDVKEGIRVPSLRIKDVQLWLNSVRQSYWRKNHERLSFKYFYCGEYGTQTLRPHYHFLLFCDLDWHKVAVYFCQQWISRFGGVKWKHRPITSDGCNEYRNVAAYCAKYACKPCELDSPYVTCGCVEKPRRCGSKGLGAALRDRIVSCFWKIVDAYNYRRTLHLSTLFPVEKISSALVDDINELFTYRFSYRKKSKFGSVNEIKTYAYTMPRYVKSACLPKRTYVHWIQTRRRDGSWLCRLVGDDVPNSQNVLSHALQVKVLELYSAKLQGLAQVDGLLVPDGFASQGELDVFVASRCLAVRSARQRFQKLVDFYAASRY